MNFDRDVLKSLILSWLGMAIRAAALAAGAWLKTTGHLPGADVDSAVSRIVSNNAAIAGDLLMLGAFGWSAVQKWWSHRKLQAVKQSPAGTSVAQAVARFA